MPTFLSAYRLGLLVALVSALTGTWWGIGAAALVLLTLAAVRWAGTVHLPVPRLRAHAYR